MSDKVDHPIKPGTAPLPATMQEGPGPTPPPREKSRSSGSLGWWVVSVFMVLLMVMGVRAYLGLETFVDQLLGLPGQVVQQWKADFPAPAPTPLPTIRVLPPVLEQVRSMARLQTTAYYLSTVIEVERPSGWPGTGQRLLLVASGKVTAGIDLSKLQESDVTTIGTKAVLHLPDPEVFDATLQEDRTYVYDYEKGLFARYEPNLQTEARQRAVEEFRATALTNGILAEARRQSEWEVQRLLLLLGYEVVEFR